MKIAAVLTGFLFSGLPLSAAVVDTIDNTSTSGDGKISLLEAITNVTDGETISFNIPGPGPHYIVTPDAGYPIIAKNGVVIDGYTQPGAAANTAGLREPNNAKLRIVLDSRTATPGAKRTVLDYDGFSLTESAVIGLVDAHGASIRGLAFIGVAGSDNPSDPYVYNVAFVRESSGSRVQGCWFGLDPGVTSWAPGPDGVVAGVYGARSAVASFRGDGLESAGLIFGNDTTGSDNRGEFNICMAQRLAVHLQTPAVRICGNWINVFPDGSLLNLEKQGLTLEDNSLEAIENGNPLGMLIGTDGNGTGDADEGNIIGPIKYDVVVECWGSGVGIVFAGNSVGAGLDNLPAFTLPDTGLFALRKNSDLRVGSDVNGTGGAAETNHIHGLGAPFIDWHGNNDEKGGNAAVVNVRRNDLINNYGAIPQDSSSLSNERAYAEVMLTPASPLVTINPLSTPTFLQGTVPSPKAEVTALVLDVYLADAFGLYQFPPAPQGRYWLGSFPTNSDMNPDPGLFALDTSAFNLTAAELGRVTITATYSLTSGRAVTTNFSSTLTTLTAPPSLDALTITKDPGGLQLQWTGGTAPFGVFTAPSPAGPWSPLATVSAQTYLAPLNGPRRFYKVREGLSPR